MFSTEREALSLPALLEALPVRGAAAYAVWRRADCLLGLW